MQKPEKKDKHFTMRLPVEVREKLRQQAEANTRTMAAQALHYIKQGLERKE